ncbi:MAG: PKD domain-containing protein, partial [Candidatus Nanopelagicales bacterium]
MGFPTLFWADSTISLPQVTATYHWDFGDGVTGNSRNTSHAYLAAGTYTVTLTITDTAGCEGVKSHTITVTPPPVAHFSANADNCQGQAVAFTNLSFTTAGFLTTWIWNYGDGTADDTIHFPGIPNTSHSYAVTGTFQVTLTVINSEGCKHSENKLINVSGAPTALFMSSGHCLGDAVHFTDLTTTSGSQMIAGWSWNFGDPASGIFNTSALQNPSHSYASAGTYTIRLIATTGNACADTITDTITILPKPAVDFTSQSACQDNPALFFPSGMQNGAISSWYWDFGDGHNSLFQSPSHIYTFAGTYTVILTVTDTSGCSASRSHPIIIVPLPVVNFDYTSPTCSNDAVQFSNLTTAGSGFIARWLWNFGDGNTLAGTFPNPSSASHPYLQSGTFNVVLTVWTSDSCTSQLSKTITVLPKPTAAFSHGSACKGAPVSFTDLSLSNSTSAISSWSWNFGDLTSGTANVSTLQNPTHIFNTPGNYTVVLIAAISGGCSDADSVNIIVSAPPAVDFSSAAGCSGDTTQFTSSTAVNMNATQSWYWQFGDGTTSTLVDPVHIYGQSGTFTVTLTITDTAGCVNAKINTVTVVPGPVSAFSFSTPGCSQTAITFTDLTNANGGTINSWYWNFGDGHDTTFTTLHPTLTHTYSQPGTFLVTLTIGTQQGCGHTRQLPLTISPAPLTDFSYSNTCQGLPTQFQDETSLNGGSMLMTHSWDFGDPASGSQNTSALTGPVHTFTAAGTYTVSLITANASGCSDTLEQNVVIVAKPGVDFYADSLICLGNVTTFFTDTIVTSTVATVAYSWNFGDGTTGSTLQNPQHSYAVPGIFTVTLTIQDTSGCMNTISHPVTIHTSPTTSFTYAQICALSPTVFTDLSMAPAGDTIVSWLWDFGAAGTADTSSLQNPQYTYTTAGTYAVSLTTATENGCSQTRILPLQVWNIPTATFNYTASPCANGAVQFQDSSWSYQATVTSWSWEFEPFQFGTGQNPTHTYYAIDSCYDVKLIITDIRGCVDTATQTVCVPPELSVWFDYDNGCFATPTVFSPRLITPQAPADSLITFSWNFGDAQSTQNNSTLKSPSHTYTQPGFYTVNFHTTDKFGCQADSYQSLQVNALPVALFDHTPGNCDSTITFTSMSIDTASAITTLFWQFGDGTVDTLTAPDATITHKYAAPGQYLATLTIVDANGCTSTVSDSVKRSPCIVAAYFSGDSVLCQNYALVFNDLSTCDGTISQWDWTWGDTTTAHTVYSSYQPFTSHTFNIPGTFLVSLKVTTLIGGSPVSDSLTRRVTVLASPLAGFEVQDACYLQPTQFTDTTKANGATLLSYRWEFGDPQSLTDTADSRNPLYLYPAPGTYNPRVIVTNQSGCRDTATVTTRINGLPSVDYTHSLACIGQPTYFFDHSEPYLAPLNLWGWRVSDSRDAYIGSMQGATPGYVFDSVGVYRVLLTASDTNGCADTLSAFVQTQPSPLSAFSYLENADNVQGQLQFTDGSIGAMEYHWDFGNGEVSSTPSPLITYQEDGTFTITLVTLNEEGCSDTASMQYTMIYKGLWVPNAFAPGGTVQATREWRPAGINLATYHCEVYNRWGALVWETKLLDEKGSPLEWWDGTFMDHPVQQGIYIWKIQAVFRDGTIWNNEDIG